MKTTLRNLFLLFSFFYCFTFAFSQGDFAPVGSHWYFDHPYAEDIWFSKSLKDTIIQDQANKSKGMEY